MIDYQQRSGGYLGPSGLERRGHSVVQIITFLRDCLRKLAV